MKGFAAPDRWLVIQVDRPEDDGDRGVLVEELVEFSGRGVEEAGGQFFAYLAVPAEAPETILARLSDRLRAMMGRSPSGISYRWQPHEAWEEVWKSGFAPRRVTDRIVVCPVWEEAVAEPGQIVLVLEPGMAFGTAEHPTTRGSLRLLDARVEPGERVADIGSGSGILAIAAARLGADRVVAVEVDLWSCAVARENVARNCVEDRVEVREGAVGPDFLLDEPALDGILANIESGMLVSLIPGFRSGLREGGWVILSGILEAESLEVARAARESGLELEAVDREGGWWTGAFRAGSEIRPAAQEPSRGPG